MEVVLRLLMRELDLAEPLDRATSDLTWDDETDGEPVVRFEARFDNR
jgi:hypothetical protein